MLSLVPAADVAVENRVRRLLDNPFLVLGLGAEATADALERQGEKLLAMLAIDLPEARRYQTPLGAQERTAERVRAALAELRDPAQRLRHAWWAAGWELP